MARLRLDALDRKIIAELQINSRLSVQDLAARVGLSASPCARRIRILEEAGIITGYAAIIDQTKVGLPISVFVSIKLERQREDELDRFSQAVARWPEVVDCYLMTGSATICCASSCAIYPPMSASSRTSSPASTASPRSSRASRWGR